MNRKLLIGLLVMVLAAAVWLATVGGVVGLALLGLLFAGETPTPDVPLGEAGRAFGGYELAVPPGMQATEYPDGLGLTLPGPTGEGRATITLLPLRRAEEALDAQALRIALAFFQGRFTGLQNDFGAPEPLARQWRGVTPQGLEYVELPPCTPVGPGAAGTVRVLAVRVGDQVATVVGFDGTGKRALDEPDQVWRRLFHSLRFPAAGDPAENPLATALVGTWGVAGRSGASFTRYQADGTFTMGVGIATYVDVAADREQRTSRTAAARGTWELDGALLTERYEGDRPPVVSWIRIARQPNSAVPGGWMSRLFTLAKKPDGSPYEAELAPQ